MSHLAQSLCSNNQIWAIRLIPIIEPFRLCEWWGVFFSLLFLFHWVLVMPNGLKSDSRAYLICFKDIGWRNSALSSAKQSVAINPLLFYLIPARFSLCIAIQQTHDIPPLWLNFSSEVFSRNCENPEAGRSSCLTLYQYISATNK